jgi:ribosomal protein S18 acetylase RimI-like enzyme
MVENLTRTVKAIPQRRLKMSRPTELLARPLDFGSFRFRTITVGDVESIGRLLRLSFAGGVDDDYVSDWRQLALNTFRRGICLRSSVLLLSGKVPICAMVVVFHGRRSYSLDLAMTHPRYRNQGLAERLIRQCLNNLREMDIDSLSLWVTEENSGALRLYKRLGFEQQDQIYNLKVVIT